MILFCFNTTNYPQRNRRLTFIFTFNKPENINRGILIMYVMEINGIILGIFCMVSTVNRKKLLKIYFE